MDFIPHNDLEKDLLAVHRGERDVADFVQALMDQQVFMPVRDEQDAIAGFQRSTRAQPLIVTDEEGERVLVLFTSPERAKPMVADFPDYSGGLLTEFSWLLERLGGGVHIALNPGWEIGLDFDADTVAQLVATLPPKNPS